MSLRIGHAVQIVGFCLLTACSSPESKSRELYDLAQFEEQQSNVEHAEKLYEEIVRDYPKTAAADDARARLEQIKNALGAP